MGRLNYISSSDSGLLQCDIMFFFYKYCLIIVYTVLYTHIFLHILI